MINKSKSDFFVDNRCFGKIRKQAEISYHLI